MLSVSVSELLGPWRFAAGDKCETRQASALLAADIVAYVAV